MAMLIVAIVFCGLTTTAAGSLLSSKRRGPPYPAEYLLDVDFLTDSNNPLDEKYELELLSTTVMPAAEKTAGGSTAAEDSKETSAPYSSTGESVDTSEETSAPYSGTGFSADATEGSSEQLDLNPSNQSQPSSVPATGTNQSSSTLDTASLSVLETCTTIKPPTDDWFGKATAEVGAKCIFGLDPRDERAHCIRDESAKFGDFGWCWTKADKSEWGSCTESCPLFGQELILQEKLDHAQRVSGNLRQAQQKLMTKLAGLLNSTDSKMSQASNTTLDASTAVASHTHGKHSSKTSKADVHHKTVREAGEHHKKRHEEVKPSNSLLDALARVMDTAPSGKHKDHAVKLMSLSSS